jgi:hypothetical protein
MDPHRTRKLCIGVAVAGKGREERGYGHVHQHDVGGRSPYLREGTCSVVNFTDDFDVWLSVEQNYQTFLGKFGVEHHDYSYRPAVTHD